MLKKKRLDKKTSAYWNDAVHATEELHRKAERAGRRRDLWVRLMLMKKKKGWMAAFLEVVLSNQPQFFNAQLCERLSYSRPVAAICSHGCQKGMAQRVILKKKMGLQERCFFSSWDWIGRTDSVLRLFGGHSRQPAATRHKRPLAATCGHSWKVAASGCTTRKWLQVAVFPNFKYRAFSLKIHSLGRNT